MTFQPYGLDRIAQQLVLVCRPFQDNHGKTIIYRNHDVLNESYKMRTTVAYGLERFWGEHLRLGADTPKGGYWKDVWDALALDILEPANIILPNQSVVLKPPGNSENKESKNVREQDNSRQIHEMANKLWKFAQEKPYDQRIALSVLTQLCDCIVWWTQRYKGK